MRLHGWVYDLETGGVSYWDDDLKRFVVETSDGKFTKREPSQLAQSLILWPVKQVLCSWSRGEESPISR